MKLCQENIVKLATIVQQATHALTVALKQINSQQIAQSRVPQHARFADAPDGGSGMQREMHKC